MNDYKGFKSQALDFNVYSDGIGVLTVTPQYALTRENNGTEYYSTDGTWKTLTVETTVDKAIGKIQGEGQDAWWVGDGFETLLKEYWNKDNSFSNIIWTRDETIYDGDKPTLYTDPREDAGGSAISQWCLDNDRTLINGAHIATGTVTAQQIDTGLLNAAGVVVTSSGSSDNGLLKPVEETLDIAGVIQSIPAGGTIPSPSANNTYTLALIAKHGGLRLDLTKLVEDQTYKLKFTFTDLYNTDAGTEMGAVPVTRLGGNIGWPIVNFKILKATINGVPVDGLSLYSVEGENGGYLLDSTKDTSDIEIEFVYMGMNNPEYNPDGTDNANNYFYISPNRCLADQKQQTYTQITITEISCKPCQYILISQGSFVTPTETDPNWKNEFPEWEGIGSVWRRIATKTLGADNKVSYNYGPAQLLTAGECARLMADKAGKSVGDWCKDKDVTILDGSNLMTGTIDASEVKVTHLDASNITAGMFTVGKDRIDDDNNKLDESEIVFQAGYDADEEPLVKIGGFTVTTDSLYSRDADDSTAGIMLSTAGGTTPVIKAGEKFAVSPEGEITASAGTIGGFNIDANSIASGSGNTGIKLTSGATGTTPVIQAGTKFNVYASGNIEAKGGNIGGWEIKGDEKTLSSGEGTATVGLNAAGSTTTPAIWAGATDADNAPCRIYPDGKFQLYKGTIEINSEGSSNTTLGGLLSNENYQSTQINSDGVGFINTGSADLLWGLLGNTKYTGTSSFKIIPNYSSIVKSSKNGVTFDSSSQCGVVIERQALTTVFSQKQLVVEAATLDNTALRFNYLKINNYDSSTPAISADSTTCGLSSTTTGTLAVNTSTEKASWIFSDRFFSNTDVKLDNPGDNNQYPGNAASVVGLSSKSGIGYAIWVGENDALHEKEFRVGHTGELFCKQVNGGGAISIAADAGNYKIVAGTTNISTGKWKNVYTIAETGVGIIAGFATVDGGTATDGGNVSDATSQNLQIDWLDSDRKLYVGNNTAKDLSCSWMFIYKV